MTALEIAILAGVLGILALVPSSSVALVVTRTVTAGFANGVAASCGIVLGDLLFVALAMSGITMLAETLGGLFLVVRYLAGAYLLWFGVRLLRRRGQGLALQTDGNQTRLAASFLAGFFLTLGDIKAIFFYASLLPSVVDLSALSVWDGLVVLAVTAIAVGGVKIGYACAATRMAALGRGLRREREIGLAAGIATIAVGTYLIVTP